ncbi:MAG: serine protease [Gammaproteobacteria bacterium RBG_16_51_14]|nr:MAG: serine protease [Gammaproteobacteria bacterium RBG_16_51_14]
MLRVDNHDGRITVRLIHCSIFAIAMLLAAAGLTESPARKTLVLTVADAIGPATSDYIRRGIGKAHEDGASLVILRLDTPGGLDQSMRDIIRDMLASPVPVVIYVSPSGARAASAGTYMLYAAHIAAMAPGTNLGAATPVQMGGFPDIKPPMTPDIEKEGSEKKSEDNGQEDTEAPVGQDSMTKKMVNDAVAYIRSLAELRGRNAEWAVQAVREAASLSSEQALAQGVIDVIAEDVSDLLTRINGRTVNAGGHDVILDTTGMVTEMYEPDWRTGFLAVITNPNIAYMLMLLGIYGLFFELANPGYVLPGVVGAISMLLALYSLQLLPVNYAGLALILFGIGFMIAELFVPSFGALGFGGIVSFVIGSIILFDTGGSGYHVSMSVISAVSVVTAAFFLIAVRAVFNAHRQPVVSGREELVGSTGQVLEDYEESGLIRVHGEIWQACSNTSMRCGDKVRVTAVNGLVLSVEHVKEES